MYRSYFRAHTFRRLDLYDLTVHAVAAEHVSAAVREDVRERLGRAPESALGVGAGRGVRGRGGRVARAAAAGSAEGAQADLVVRVEVEAIESARAVGAAVHLLRSDPRRAHRHVVAMNIQYSMKSSVHEDCNEVEWNDDEVPEK